MDYKIIQVKEPELEHCAQVIRTGFMTVAKDFDLTEENCPTNGAFIKTERLIADMERGHTMYGLQKDDQYVGFLQLEKSTEELYQLHKLVVLPQFRHQGLGKVLLDFAKGKVEELGGDSISIGIIEENTILKKWYEAYGFVTTRIHKFEHLPFTVGFMEISISGKTKEC